MSQQFTLDVRERKEIGSIASKKLRKEGRVPAVLYYENNSEVLSISDRKLRTLLQQVAGTTTIITLKDQNNKETNVLIQGLQRNAITDKFEHVDFLKVSDKKTITTQVAVHTEGESIGIKQAGGVLEVLLHEVEITCLPKDLPEHILLDITELNVGEMVHIKDLPEISGVKYNGDPETVVISCSEVKEELSTENVEQTAETSEAEQETTPKVEGSDS